MKFKNTMLVVKDIDRTKQFYTSLIGLEVISDIGENVVFSGGLAAQTEKSWLLFTRTKENQIEYGTHNMELYFEEVNYFQFLRKVKKADVEIISEMEMPYGQRVLRIYDPDKHIVEIGEDMRVMVHRLYSEGFSKIEISEKTGFSLKDVQRFF